MVTSTTKWVREALVSDAEMAQALETFAKANGRMWRAELWEVWMTARESDHPHSDGLRRARNVIGPNALLTVKLTS